MFKHTNVIQLLFPIAEEKLIELDRKRYYPIYENVEKYVAETEGIMVGKETATKMLLRSEIDSSFQAYCFYANDAVGHARKLAVKLFDSLSSNPQMIDVAKTVAVRTKVPNKVISIIVDEREMIEISNLSTHRGIYVIDVIGAVKIPGLFLKDLELSCSPPENQLIEIYGILTDPSRVGDWGKYIKMEKQLRTTEISSDNGKNVADGGSRIDLSAIRAELEKYVVAPGHVLLSMEQDRIQMMTQNKFEDEKNAVRKELSGLGLRIEDSINDPKVPADQRIRSLTFYAIAEKLRKPFLDVFNTGVYSLISFDNERVATIFVKAKHMFINLWRFRLMYKMKQIENDFYKHMTSRISKEITALLSLMIRMN